MSKEQTSLEKEFLQSVLDGIEESIVVLDRDYRIVCYNNAFNGWLKRPKKKIIGEHCYTVIKDQPVRCSPCIVRETFRTGQFFETSHSHDLGGRKVHHETNAYPIKDANSEVKYVIYMFKDITERAMIEEKVRELNKFKEKILDNAGIAINILDEDGNIMNSNRGAGELFGHAEEDIRGEPHSIFYRNEDKELLAKAMHEVLEKGKFESEVTLIKKNRTEFPARLTLTTVEDDHEKPAAIIEIVDDLTQLKKAERVIKQQLEQLKELDTIKEEYFYSTSHEFKTPLTSIVGLTKMLLDEKVGKLNGQQKEALNLVYCDSKRLRGAVQKILDIARMESGKMIYHIDKVDLNSVMSEVLETVGILFESKNLKVTNKIGGDIPHVIADKERIALVIENIISNSIKFTPVGGRIDVTASVEGDNVLVQIHDTGVGIPEEDKEKIFEKYYQVKSGMGENVGGSGLGLVICKKIVEDLGGKIWVESKLSEGSTFNFRLPYKESKQHIKKK
ncbi:MAG: PAS domain-containing sensor histidine kinase [Candidatus Altiarchaeota archaeon]|nr:PAS domain-containing sensor histidine kinase [Candidatus Altiarchaeota archaeon]